MRHDSHLKMLVSGSSKRAISPRDRSGRSRFSYGYFLVTGRGCTKCSSVRSIPVRIPLTYTPEAIEIGQGVGSTEGPRAVGNRPPGRGVRRRVKRGSVETPPAASPVHVSSPHHRSAHTTT